MTDQQSTAVSYYDRACHELMLAADLKEVKQISDKAKALAEYARRHGDKALEVYSAEIRVRAAWNIGRLVAALDTMPGARTDLNEPVLSAEKGFTKHAAITAAGLTVPTAGRREQLFHAISEEELERMAAEKRDEQRPLKLTELERLIRKTEAIRRATALPTGKYRVIYADPPWQYSDTRNTGDHWSATAAEQHYPTMPLDEICKLPVRALAADSCVLFCWGTAPLLPDALEVIESWGFEYKTFFVWDKGRGAFGHYHNGAAELLFVATNGSCLPDSDTKEDQVQEVKRGRHSAKPEEFRELIDRMYPHGPRIELFRRGDAPHGWDVWGSEAVVETVDDAHV